jgi:hypothetical protein
MPIPTTRPLTHLKYYLYLNEDYLTCPGCHTPLYRYTGSHTGVVKSVDFIPLNENIPPPQVGEPIVCPICEIDLGAGIEAWMLCKLDEIIKGEPQCQTI